MCQQTVHVYFDWQPHLSIKHNLGWMQYVTMNRHLRHDQLPLHYCVVKAKIHPVSTDYE